MVSNAVSFRKGNVEDLKNKLMFLLENKEQVESYKNVSQEYICDRYNWDDVVKKTVKLY